MRLALYFLTVILLYSCSPSSQEVQALQQKIDSLEVASAKKYIPSMGVFMMHIQNYHEKLYAAVAHENWELAEFELEEMEENFDDIREFKSYKPEVKVLPMIDGPMEEVKAAVEAKDKVAFNEKFEILTNTCNACHKATDHGFIEIKIPTGVSLSNQSFDISIKK